MLWDLIRDFFVMHVFGGCTTDGTFYNATIGALYDNGSSFIDVSITTNEVLFPIGHYIDSGTMTTQISLADWLSTTATIISITIIVVLCAMFIYKIVRLVGGLIR